MSKKEPVRRRSRRCGNSRRGAAVIEAAFCLPLIVFLMLASIEASTMVYLDHGLSVAAYEGARVGAQADGTNADVQIRCNAVLTGRSVRDANITVNPSDLSSIAKGTAFTITVTAPCEANSFLPGIYFYGGKSLSGTCAMVKE